MKKTVLAFIILAVSITVQAQNLQATQNNNRQKFITACNAIEYARVKNNENASAYQKMCARIIEANEELLIEYNSVLHLMVNIGK